LLCGSNHGEERRENEEVGEIFKEEGERKGGRNRLALKWEAD